MTGLPVTINNSRDPFNGNLGDAVSRHDLYHPWLFGAPRANVDRFAFFGDPRIRKRGMIVGGGGLLDNALFKRPMTYVIEQSRRIEKSVFWGGGVNHHLGSRANQVRPRQFEGLRDFDLVGIRDYVPESGLRWVPCSSVMLPELEMEYGITRPVVVFNNWQFKLHQVPDGVPVMNNNLRFSGAMSKRKAVTKVIAYLGSAETVVTSAYHCALWATLLGRRVVVVDPFSSKFRYFRHPPGIVESNMGWTSIIDAAISHPGVLPEYREANSTFAEEVKNFFGVA